MGIGTGLRSVLAGALGAALVAAGLLTGGTATAAAAAVTSAGGAGFSPNPGSNTNYLFGVSVRSSSSAWAVGYYSNSNNVNQSLVLHWNGTKWSHQTTPNPGPNGNQLSSVKAFASSNVWAVGYYSDASFTSEYLALHWNGSAWSQQAIPVPSSSSSALSEVTGTSASDMWISGWYGCGSLSCNFTLHWNGTAWSVVSLPTNASSDLYVRSGTSVWSVGTYYDNPSNTYRTVANRWNGNVWKLFSTPDPDSAGENWFNTVNGDSANDIWAAGWICPIVSGTCGFDKNHDAFIGHWNGTTWSQATTGVPSTTPSGLQGVKALSATDAWTVGNICPASDCSTVESLALNWNGTSWSTVTTPDPGSATNALLAVDGTAATNVFAVGYYSSGGGLTQTLVLHWNGTSWSQT